MLLLIWLIIVVWLQEMYDLIFVFENFNFIYFCLQILVNDWLPRVADLMEAMSDYWRDLVPMKSSFVGRGEMLFNCIHALMSHQLNGLIRRSLEHLYETIEVYKVSGTKVRICCVKFCKV